MLKETMGVKHKSARPNGINFYTKTLALIELSCVFRSGFIMSLHLIYQEVTFIIYIDGQIEAIFKVLKKCNKNM